MRQEVCHSALQWTPFILTPTLTTHTTVHRISTMAEIVRVASAEIALCTQQLRNMSAPMTRQELFAGSLPIEQQYRPPQQEFEPPQQPQEPSYHGFVPLAPLTSYTPLPEPIVVVNEPQIIEHKPLETLEPPKEPVDALSTNVLEILVENWKKCKRELRGEEPMQANQLRDLLRPANKPPAKGKEGKSFTSLLKQIPGVRMTSIQRKKHGKFLPAEPAFVLSEEAIEFLKLS